VDNNEAKFILEAYRPNGADAASPVFEAALTQAQHDPALRNWFEKEQARDRVIAAKLKTVALPPGLRESILTGARFTSRQRRSWFSPLRLGLAASLVLVATLAAVWRYRTVQLDMPAIMAAVADDAAHEERHGSKGASVDRLASMLANPSVHLSAPMPVDLAKMKAEGCRTLSVGRREILELCFERNGGVFHLYVMQRPRTLDTRDGVRFTDQQGIRSMAWADTEHLYVVATTQGEAALKALL
jgi:hypothetical protein